MEKVTIYTAPTCVHCKAAKAYMKEHNIPYEEKNVMEDADARSWMLERGYRGVPVITVNEEEIVGFDKERLESLLEK